MIRMKNKRYNYRQGIITTINHPSLERGQIVQIIREEEFHYVVQSNVNSSMERVEKKDVSFD
jgi:hypothetical protein